MDTSSNKALADSLDSCVDKADWTVNFLLRNIATSAMEQAVYFSTGAVTQEKWSHYGLALDKYTHFTSPIRRYADIIVHRLLLASLALDQVTPTTSEGWWAEAEDKDLVKASSNPEQQLTNVELQELCEHINDRNRAAQRAQRDSQTLFQSLYFKDRPLTDPRCVVDAVIFALRDNGVLVYVPQYGLKGPVYLESKDKEVSEIHFSIHVYALTMFRCCIVASSGPPGRGAWSPRGTTLSRWRPWRGPTCTGCLTTSQ